MTALVLIATLALQGTPSPLQADSAHVTVNVLDRGSDDAGARLMITRKDTTRYHIVTINRALGRVNSVRLSEDEGRVIAIAERGFAVIDPLGRRPGDEVYGDTVKPSPNGRWIAYVRYLRDAERPPVHGIVIYDTNRTPDDNHSAFVIAAERSSAAGQAAFPPAAAWTRSSALNPRFPQNESPCESPVCNYEWVASDILVGFMRLAPEDVVILVDLSAPAMRVCTKDLPNRPEWGPGIAGITHSTRPDGSHVVTVQPAAAGSRADQIVFPANCTS